MSEVRLIDANAVDVSQTVKGISDFAECIRDAVQTTLDNAPTVDTKLIVHAHWIEGQTDNPNIHNILCSCCFEGFPSKGHANSQYTKKKFKWCPSCGAKMDDQKLKYTDQDTMMPAT